LCKSGLGDECASIILQPESFLGRTNPRLVVNLNPKDPCLEAGEAIPALKYFQLRTTCKCALHFLFRGRPEEVELFLKIV
jgi:hypothetical protein